MMIYEKSARGYIEFSSNKRTLGVRERQVLLLVNGIRTLDDLEKFFKKDHLLETLQKLESGGFIQEKQEASKTAALSFKEASDGDRLIHIDDVLKNAPTTANVFEAGFDHPISAETLEAVKIILLEASEDYLGLMGRAIKTRISSCVNETDLRNCISSWHMAMRESKLGRESTSFLMQQIHHVLEYGAPKTDWSTITTPIPVTSLHP
jgi:hypothetical protein